jgi:hypothetical protein
MGNVVKSLFGGSSDNGAKKAAEESKKAQAIANDRQLAEVNRQDQATAISRRAPRGRRLFEDGPESITEVLA